MFDNNRPNQFDSIEPSGAQPDMVTPDTVQPTAVPPVTAQPASAYGIPVPPADAPAKQEISAPAPIPVAVQTPPSFGQTAPVRQAAPGEPPLAGRQAPGEPSVSMYTPPTYVPARPAFPYDRPGGAPAPLSPIKQKKQRGFGSTVAAMLAVAVLSSGMTGAIVWNMHGTGTDTAEGSTTKEVKTINVTGTANSLVEAVAEKVAPCVVGIRTTSTMTSFFGDQTGAEEGSGVIYKADGYVITNYHVISSAITRSGSKIEVFLPTDASDGLTATLVGYDSPTDLAVLKINKTGLSAIELGDSSTLKVGQTVIAIGNPGGLEFMGSVSAGIISGLDRKVVLEDVGEMSLLQTDATINPGNSGGALVDAQGKLIGINNSKMSAANFEGMGFSIPVNTVKNTVEDLIQNKDVPKPYVGIEISTRYDEQALVRAGYPAGIVVGAVVDDGPASKAGLRRGDIITEFNGTAVKSVAAFNSAKNKCRAGDSVTIKVYRAGQYTDLKITLG